MNRLLHGSLLAVALTATSAGLASAQQVTAIRVSRERDATTSNFQQPEGTQSLWIAYDYTGSGSFRLSLDVVAPGNLTIFEHTENYSGDGTDQVLVTGDEVVQRIADEIEIWADDVLEQVQQAQSQASTETYIAQARASINLMQSAVGLLARVELSDAADGAVADLRTSVRILDEQAEEAAAAPAEQRKDKASAMEPEAQAAADDAAALSNAVEGLSGLAIPPSEGVEETRAYSIIIRVNSNPSKSAEMWVFGSDQAPGSGTKPTGEATQATTAPGQRTPTPQTRSTQSNPGGGAATTGTTGETARVVPASMATATALARAGVAPGPVAPGAATTDPFVVDAPFPTPVQGVGEPQGDPLASMLNPGVAPVATWTLPAPPSSSAGGSPEDMGPGGEPDGGNTGGPNLGILAIGLAVLGAMAVWLKQRM